MLLKETFVQFSYNYININFVLLPSSSAVARYFCCPVMYPLFIYACTVHVHSCVPALVDWQANCCKIYWASGAAFITAKGSALKGGTERESSGLEEPEDDSSSINHFVNEHLSPLQLLETDVRLSVRGCLCMRACVGHLCDQVPLCLTRRANFNKFWLL